MNSIEKLAIAVAKMKEKMPPTCHYLSAIRLVLRELDEAPAWDARTRYFRGDLVLFETALYQAKRDVPRNGGCAPADHGFWKIVDASTKEAIAEQVEEMLRLCRNLCCGYDNLKALMGRLEREQGVEAPRFWCGEINTTGEPEKCKQAAMLNPPAQLSPGAGHENPTRKSEDGERQQ